MSKLQDEISNAKTFAELMAMNGEVPVGKLAPLEESEEHGHGAYVISVTQNNDACILGIYNSHYDAVRLLRDEKMRIEGLGGKVTDLLELAKRGNLVDSGRVCEGFVDEDAKAVYKIHPVRTQSLINAQPPAYIALTIDANGKPVEAKGFSYSGPACRYMQDLYERHSNDKNVKKTVTPISNFIDAIKSVETEGGSTYLLRTETVY